MTKLTLASVSKAVAGRELFRDLTLEITPGMRLAILGPNGCGKSTLLRLIAKESDPDSGRILMPPEIRLGFVTQEMDQDTLAVSLLGYVMSSLPSWSLFWREWDKVKDEAQIEQLAKEQAVLESRYGYNPEFQARTVLHGLGFADTAFDQPLSTFSGGWRERAKLARAIVGGVDVLLLDEPTNHLDLEAVLWLEEYLIAFRGVVVFVAHDRLFLDRVATHVLAFGGGKTLFRKGNYRDYVQWRTERDSFLTQQSERIQDEISRKQVFVDRFRYKATKAVQAQSRVNQIDKLKNDLEALALETIQKDRTLSFTWPTPLPAGKVAVSCEDLVFAFSGRDPVLSKVTLTLMKGQKVAIVGANGTGKTTLLKLIAGEISPSSGRVALSSNTVIGYYSQHQTEVLRPDNQVIDEIRRLSQGQSTDAELKSVLGLFLLGERFWEEPVRHLSGGEKSRLVLGSLFLKRANLLILDEPTNHLDLESREALIRALRSYTGAILLVAHDRHLLATAAEDIWVLRDHALTPVNGGLTAYLDEMAPTKEREKVRPAEHIEKSPSRRMDKREQAEIRNQFYRELKPLREEYSKTEAKLDEALQRQDLLERQLADPATYERLKEFGSLQREYYLVRDLTEELFARLSSTEERIKKLDAQRLQLLGDEP